MLIGHQKQWQFLKKSIEMRKISHAYLFSGQERLGKKTLALEFAKLLTGQESAAKINPDLNMILPEDNEIKIAQIREMTRLLSLKPYSAPFKIAIIDQAHCMNWPAQTALLKTLEEPKGESILILISEYPEMLLSTILSRIQKIKFYPVKKEEIEKYLKEQKIEGEGLEELCSISLGKPGEAVNFVSDPRRIEILRQRIKELNKIKDADLVLRFQYAKDLSQSKEGLREVLDIWTGYFRDALISAVNNQPTKYSLNKLKDILNLIQNTKFLLFNTNANSRLAFERLMLEL